MAIQINILEGSSQYGIAFNNAYYRVAGVAIGRQRDVNPKFVVSIHLSAYATPTPDENTREVDFKIYDVNLTDIEAATGTTFLDKCYAWVMAQDDMTGSSAV